jgi:hypothetical protein
MDPDAHLFLTVADEDENQVLELVRSDSQGIFIRDHGQWMMVADEDDNPRVWDRIIIDVNHDIVSAFDGADTGDDVTVDMFKEYVIEEDSQ